MLELRVHLGPVVPRDAYALLEVDCPDGLVTTLARSRWPRRWDAVPFSPATQRLGDRWLAAGRGVALRVPSVHSGSDFNVLLNPVHPDARRLRIVSRTRYEFDARLF